jgi:hypothetical protein
LEGLSAKISEVSEKSAASQPSLSRFYHGRFLCAQRRQQAVFYRNYRGTKLESVFAKYLNHRVEFGRHQNEKDTGMDVSCDGTPRDVAGRAGS